jgi:hypothetical protein
MDKYHPCRQQRLLFLLLLLLEAESEYGCDFPLYISWFCHEYYLDGAFALFAARWHGEWRRRPEEKVVCSRKDNINAIFKIEHES